MPIGQRWYPNLQDIPQEAADSHRLLWDAVYYLLGGDGKVVLEGDLQVNGQILVPSAAPTPPPPPVTPGQDEPIEPTPSPPPPSGGGSSPPPSGGGGGDEGDIEKMPSPPGTAAKIPPPSTFKTSIQGKKSVQNLTGLLATPQTAAFDFGTERPSRGKRDGHIFMTIDVGTEYWDRKSGWNAIPIGADSLGAAAEAGSGLLLRTDGTSTLTGARSFSQVITLTGVGGTGQIEFNSGAAPNGEGIQYWDSTANPRFGIGFFPTDVVAICNRAVNGKVELRANTSTGGGPGEVTAVVVEDDQVTFNTVILGQAPSNFMLSPQGDLDTGILSSGADTLQMACGNNNIIQAQRTGGISYGKCYGHWEIDGNLDHDGSNIGFFGTTPVAQTAAYTNSSGQTASRVLGSYTADDESSSYTGIDNAQGGTPYAQVTDLNALRVAYENLRAYVEDLAKWDIAAVDDLQSYGLFG